MRAIANVASYSTITRKSRHLRRCCLSALPARRRLVGWPNSRPFNVWDVAGAEGIGKFAGLATEQAHWQQEAEVARINEETMRRANALKDEFLAITAHEFRTPLTVILAHSQMATRALKRST